MKIAVVYQREVIILPHRFSWDVSWRHALFHHEMYRSPPHTHHHPQDHQDYSGICPGHFRHEIKPL